MGPARSLPGAGNGRFSVATAAASWASARGEGIGGVLAGFQVSLPTDLILFGTFLSFFLLLEERGWRRGAEQWGVFTRCVLGSTRAQGHDPSGVVQGRVHLPEPGSRTTAFPFFSGMGGGAGFAGSGLCSHAGATRVRCAPGCGLALQAPLNPPARETRLEGAHGPQSLASMGGQRRLRFGF